MGLNNHEMPDQDEIRLLISHCYRAMKYDLLEECEAVTTYEEYTRLWYYLEANMPQIDQIPNPSMKDINAFINKLK
jgi:hypothetical protein